MTERTHPGRGQRDLRVRSKPPGACVSRRCGWVAVERSLCDPGPERGYRGRAAYKIAELE
jgi:hypothetical protein